MDYEFNTLPNGLRLATVSMSQRHSVAVGVWVRVGGRFENKRLSGASHFLEHLLFKGTRKRSTRQIKEEIEGVGGILNAFTSEEATCYFAQLLREHYPKALDVLSDMVNNATLDAAELNKERTVIMEEIKMYKDLPAQYVQEMMGEMLWPGQPLGMPIAGTIESVRGLNRTGLVDFKKRYYHPRNILVTVAGSVDHGQIRQWVENNFPPRPQRPFIRFERAGVRQAQPRTRFFEKQTEQTHLVVGLHGLSQYHKDRYGLVLLNVILGGNMSSRLFEEIRERRGLAYEIKSGVDFLQDAGTVIISAGVETRKAGRTIALILRELEKIRYQGVKEGELKRAKEYSLSQLYMALEDTLDHLLWVGSKVLYRDELPDLAQIRRDIEKVTVRDVQDIARRLFENRNLNLALIGPVGPKDQARIKENFGMKGAC